MLVCPVCRDSRALRLARSTGRLDGILRLLQFYSYRCDSCQKRFRHFGKQTLETAPAEPLLPPIVADPTTFKTLRFEGDNRLPKAKRELEKVEVTEDGRPKPILLARTWDVPTPKGTSLSNPLAMAPLELEPHELPVREAATARFDPLVLLEEVGEDEAPMRAEGDHIFDPLAMENKVLERAIEVNATRSRLHTALAANAEARRARQDFFASEEGRPMRALWKRRRLWIFWSALAIQGALGVVALYIYIHLGYAGLFDSRRLWLSASVAYLITGTVLALIYPRFNAEHPGVLPPRFVELAIGWVGFGVCLHFGEVVILFPLLSGATLNFGFYRSSWPWLWIAYGSIGLAAGIGWLVSLLQPKANPKAA